MKAAVTGATGFVGGKLVEKLVEKGYEVRALARKTSDVSRLEKLGVEIYYGDLSDKDSLEKFPSGCELIFHIAAFVSDWGDKKDFYEQNVEATKTLLDASAKHNLKRFIHMSSSTVIWKSTFSEIHNLKNVDESYPYPEKYNDDYNETKSLSEKLVIKYNGKENLETVAIRPSNIWGAGDTVILPRIAEAALKGFLVNMGTSSKIVSPVNINNLIHGVLLAAESEKAPGNIYFINDGVEMDNTTFVKGELNAAGIEWEPKITVPYKIGYSIAFIMEMVFKILRSKKPPVLTRFAVSALSGSRTYSIKKAREQLGYEPVCSYQQGMNELKEWIDNIGGYKKLIG